MSEPLKITALLSSPLAGEAPMLDALLERYAFIHNICECAKLSKGIQLNSHDALKYYMIELVPLEEHTFKCGKRCYCVSSPIVDVAHETVEHYSTRMDFNALKSRVIDVSKIKTDVGPYAPTFEPFRVRTVRGVSWYARGEKRYIKKWLSDIKYIGSRTSAGFGAVSEWIVESTDQDYWITANGADKPVLMRPVPIDEFSTDDIYGAQVYYGAIVPPYWHPQRQMEILRPC